MSRQGEKDELQMLPPAPQQLRSIQPDADVIAHRYGDTYGAYYRCLQHGFLNSLCSRRTRSPGRAST